MAHTLQQTSNIITPRQTPPACLIFSKIDMSAHYRSSLLSTHSSRPHFQEMYAHRHPSSVWEKDETYVRRLQKVAPFAYPEVWFLLKHLWYPRLSPHRDASLNWQSCCCCFYSIALPFYRLLFLTLVWRVFTSLSSALIPRQCSHRPCEPTDTGDGQVLSLPSLQSTRPQVIRCKTNGTNILKSLWFWGQ